MSRTTIGFLINDLASTYQYALWCGVDAACREAGVDLLVFTGGEIGSDDPVKAVRERVYQLANRSTVAGLVVGAPTVANYLTPMKAAEFCRSFGVPVVTIGIELPGVPAVLVNNAAGMEAAMEHLVVERGRRRIGFIGGSIENPEAKARHAAWRHVLERHGLAPLPGQDRVANWDHGVAYDLTADLLERFPDLDAVVAANDDMALGVLKRLLEDGRQVPHEVAVCGFDDIEDSRSSKPPLSTVRQPMREQGEAAVRMLLASIDSEGHPTESVHLSATFVGRQSTGCVSQELCEAFVDGTSLSATGNIFDLETIAQESKDALVKIFPHLDHRLLGDLSGALAQDLRTGGCEVSLAAMDRLLGRTPEEAEARSALQGVVNHLRLSWLPRLAASMPRLVSAESVWHQQRLQIAESTLGAEALHRVQHERLVRQLHTLSAQLTTSFELSAMLRELRHYLPLLGIRNAYLLQESEPGTAPSESRVVLALEDGRALPLPVEGLLVPEGRFLPAGHQPPRGRRTFVVEPLSFQDISLGFFVYEQPPTRGQVFDALRSMISGAIQGARLVVQIEKRTKELEEANEDLSNTNRKVRDILDNIEQALFAVDLEGVVQSETSRSVRDVLGVEDPSRTGLRGFLHLTNEKECEFREWLSLVSLKHRSMRWDKLTRLAPVQDIEILVEGAPRYIRVRYQKMLDARGQLARVMVLAVDETETRRVEQMLAAQRQGHEKEVRTILGLVHNLPESIADFLADAAQRIDRLRTDLEPMLHRATAARAGWPDAPAFVADDKDLASLGRDLHTIKGNAGTYGFDALSRQAHVAEDLLDALRPPVELRTAATLQQILDAVAQMEAELVSIHRVRRELADPFEGAVARVTAHRVDRMQELARQLRMTPSSGKLDELLELVDRARYVPLPRLAGKYARMVGRIAERLRKIVRVSFAPEGVELPPHLFNRLDEAMAHLIRNAVDHGLELPKDRLAAGKPEEGNLVIEVAWQGSRLELRIRDDGRGIDDRALARRVVEKGLRTEKEVEALDERGRFALMFLSGVSTARAVSDISGRGVGLDAVARSIEELGGQLGVESVPGRGTTFRITLPEGFGTD